VAAYSIQPLFCACIMHFAERDILHSAWYAQYNFNYWWSQSINQ